MRRLPCTARDAARATSLTARAPAACPGDAPGPSVGANALKMRQLSTWQIAAGGLQRKWRGIKQRTAWRYRALKDRDVAIVFSADKQKEVHLKPHYRHMNDPLACHNVLATASAASLNGILGATSPDLSSQFCKTMVGFMLLSSPPAMRARVLDVITKQRLQEISISNRALVIRAIQRCLMSPLHTEKAVLYSAACNILCGTYGRELSLLKEQIHADEEAFIDESGELAFEERPGEERLSLKDSYKDPPHSGDLIHLIYANKNLTEVVKVVQHIAVESLAVKEEEPHLVKVVSDIDDTLFAGWIDRRYPLHIPYPGVSDLYARVSRGFSEDSNGEPIRPSITFLTARPRGWLSVGRYLTLQHLKSLGVANVTVLTGSVTGLVSTEKIAKLKLENFSRFASLFPEFKFVFFGDSGQGDALLASRLLESFPAQVVGTFIHDVNPTSTITGDGRLKAVYAQSGVDFYLTYAGAAFAAHKKGLITETEMIEVVDATKKDLNGLPFIRPDGAVMKARRLEELERDIAAIRAYLQISQSHA